MRLCLLIGNLSELLLVTKHIKSVHSCVIAVSQNDSRQNLGDNRTQNELVHMQGKQLALIVINITFGCFKTELINDLCSLILNILLKFRWIQLLGDKGEHDRQMNIDELETCQLCHERFFVVLLVLLVLLLDKVDGQFFERIVNDAYGQIQ